MYDFAAFLRTLGKYTFLGGAVGVLAGTASAVFLVALDWATATRIASPALVLALPIGGFAVGWIYHRFAGAAAQGNTLVIETLHTDDDAVRIPLRMAPLILLGTVITHLFGGSAGREGTAIQMGASLAEGLRRVLRLGPVDRRLLIMAGISGGFGSVFGTPVAGLVFGMEVQHVGRIRYEGLIPCLAASYVGDLVTRAWGVGHAHYPQFAPVSIDAGLLIKVVIAGIVFGLTSTAFIELIHLIKHMLAKYVRYMPLRPLLGGVVIVALSLLLNTQDYLGLSLPLLMQSLDGTGVIFGAFALKLLSTTITLGSGFLGGEVTPLFVIGATLGYTLGHLLSVDPAFMASLGFVAVFAGASNTPLACALMGIELFGGGAPVYLILACVMAYLSSGHRSIYGSQRVDTPKNRRNLPDDLALSAMADRVNGDPR